MPTVRRWAARGRVLSGTDLLGRGGSRGRLHSPCPGESIFTEADGIANLYDKVRDSVRCHFEDGEVPKVIRLHFVREEVITA